VILVRNSRYFVATILRMTGRIFAPQD
jgi:hypothetical protein